MSDQSSTKNPKILEKLTRLYQLRQNKLRKEYQQHQATVASAQAEFKQRERDYQAVQAESAQLKLAESSNELASNLRAQQQIQIKRHWLKYDSEKTEYFLDGARCELNTEQQKADQLRSQWMRSRNRHEQFQEQHVTAVRAARSAQSLFEEREQEEQAHSRRSGVQHHG